MYKANDVCIVGRGCVFAGSWNAEEFLDGLFEGTSFITDLREASADSFPWDVNLVYNPDRKAEDQSYTPYGAFIDRVKLADVVRENGGKWEELTTLEAVALEAMRAALKPVAGLSQVRRAEIILGVSTIDTEATFQISDQIIMEVTDQLNELAVEPDEKARLRVALEQMVSRWKHRKPDMSYVVASSLTDRLKKAFDVNGPAMLVDAACASSHAALHIAMKRLQQREADVIISGGADVSVSPGCLVFFSRLGAMSEQPNAPFDQSAMGLTQGEGAGMFVLMRLEDAVREKLKIYGVLRACEGSSDGRSSAIVEPTIDGQVSAYQRAYAEAGLSEVDYIEAHGTGTQLGDRTEIESLNRHFAKARIPIGSVKANVGHTIAAAGAAGLMKSLGVIERRAVPLATHFKKFQRDVKTNMFVSGKTLPLENRARPITVGQSAFGFGGSNFHLVVQEYREGEKVSGESQAPPPGVVVCGRRTFTPQQLEEFAKTSRFKYPPNILPHIEPMQIASVHLVERTLEELGIVPHLLDRDRVAVISATMIPLEGYWTAGHRVIASAVRRLSDAAVTKEETRSAIARLFESVEKKSIRVTEDTLSGFLNNIVAGRVCNAFDFKGVSFNVDADVSGWAAALRTAQTLLMRQHGMVLVISAEEKVLEKEQRLERHSLTCTIIANATYALEYDLPIAEIVSGIEFIPADSSVDSAAHLSASAMG